MSAGEMSNKHTLSLRERGRVRVGFSGEV